MHSEEERRAVCEYRIQGHTVRETADHFGLNAGWVKAVSRNLIKPTYLKPNDYIDHVESVIRERNPAFEYAGNYTGSEGTVDLRCKTCGTVVSKSWTTVKHHTVPCPVCSGIEREQRKEERKKEREAQRAQDHERMETERNERNRRAAELKAEKRKAKDHPCNVCGTMTGNRSYCSRVCANKAHNKKHEIDRRIKTKAALVDSDITLERLYKRDNGVCHICGIACNYGDILESKGTLIAGDFYPSIDHVVPLAKGGTHSWDNVKLAHRMCNYIKSDQMWA